MKQFGTLTDFHFIERQPGYDKVNNPQGLNVAELTPVGIVWKTNGMPMAIKNLAGVG